MKTSSSSLPAAKGKARVDKPSDADAAFQLYKAGLDRWSAIVASRSMAESVGTAVVTDGAFSGLSGAGKA